LGISHSGLSKAISSLAAEAKLELFRPQGRGLEITESGKWFYQKAQEILKIENEISSGIKPAQVAVGIELSEVLAMACAGALAKELPGALTLLETDIGESEGKIMINEIDFGLSFASAPKPELEYLDIGELRFNAFVRADLLKATSFDQLPFAVPASHLPFRSSSCLYAEFCSAN
jgi:DNA-binding transcriptional LysR family regulator